MKRNSVEKIFMLFCSPSGCVCVCLVWIPALWNTSCKRDMTARRKFCFCQHLSSMPNGYISVFCKTITHAVYKPSWRARNSIRYVHEESLKGLIEAVSQSTWPSDNLTQLVSLYTVDRLVDREGVKQQHCHAHTLERTYSERVNFSCWICFFPFQTHKDFRSFQTVNSCMMVWQELH